MSSRDEFDDFLDDDEEAPVIDTRAEGRLYRVPLGRLSPNLVNPRTDFGTEDDLIDFGKSLARRQNQPCPVVSRNAYLKLWPEHADRIGSIDYVLVSGERRFRGASAVGLAGLDCVVNDNFAIDHKTFMEAVVSENVDRQNFDPIEEAYAVKALVAAFGTNRAVAQHFERADGWVTQRVLLTHLAPEIQDLVRKREMPLEHARTLGKLARDKKWTEKQQVDWWEQKRREREQHKKDRKAASKTSEGPDAAAASHRARGSGEQQRTGPETVRTKPTGTTPSFTAVKHEPEQPAPTTAADTADHGVGGPEEPPAGLEPKEHPDGLPEQRTPEALPPESAGWNFPYGSAEICVRLLDNHMERDKLRHLHKLVGELLEKEPTPTS